MSFKKRWVHIVAAVTTTLAVSAYATAPGFFMGLQVGQSNVYNQKTNFTLSNGSTVLVSPSNTGFASRFLMGYNFKPYAAMEVGLTRYNRAVYDYPNGSCANGFEYALDIVGKGMVPVSVVSLFAKGGLAVLRSSQLKPTTTPGGGTKCGGNNFEQSTSARPIIGAGVSYDLSPNWVVELAYSRILKGSTSQNTDLKSLGFSYHFVDLYCGQFLC
jgi:opacity protein-like surface antigen